MKLDNYIFGVGPAFENIISKETLHDLKATYNEVSRMITYLQMAYYVDLGNGSNSDNSIINRDIKNLIEKKYFKELFNTFVRVFKPMKGSTYDMNSTFLTIDETFAVRRFNGYYYCLLSLLLSVVVISLKPKHLTSL